MTILYKTLFEIKLLHEYYVTESDGTSPFAQADQTDRINFLSNQFGFDRESVNELVQFQFPESLRQIYQGYSLFLLQGYSGCRVLMKVKPQTLADNSLVYAPVVPLPLDLNIYVQIMQKNVLFDEISHAKLGNPANGAFLFSNQSIIGAKSFPFLTAPVSAYDSGIVYEQGELASYGPGDIRVYYKNSAGDQWDPVIGPSFVNEGDRLIFPFTFNYSFPPGDTIRQADFELKDKNGNSIKKISVTSTNPLSKTTLDFSDKRDVLAMPPDFLFPDILFTLEVTADNGYDKTHTLLFSDEYSNRINWGLIHFKPVSDIPQYNLFMDDGYLFKRRDGGGVWQEAPVFEIPVKSRYAYWRYSNDLGKEIKLIPGFTDYLEKENEVLISVKPRPLTKYYFKVKKAGSSTDTKYIPNPMNYDLKKDDTDRYFLDIVVPRSDLFPIVP